MGASWCLQLAAVLPLALAGCTQNDDRSPDRRPEREAAPGGMLAPGQTEAETPLARETPPSMAEVAARVTPSVVNVWARQAPRTELEPLLRDPFFREFFGDRLPPGAGEQISLGSGVITSGDGIVVTNHHVIEGAEEIRVTLANGRELPVEVVGTDPKSDLAVLRVQTEEGDGAALAGVSPAGFADSSEVRPGDVVLAIGNPYGVGQTVTMGIVSATGRGSIGLVDYGDFLQTDAAINPGNSGGALVNMRGEVVGINTAILSRTGGYQGIGFAIPSNVAQPIVASLIERGEVVRGWLGVVIQEIDRELALALGMDSARGVLIADVVADGPAAQAGLQRGDVILSIDDNVMNTPSELQNYVASRAPGTRVQVSYLRGGTERTTAVELGTLPAEEPEEDAAPSRDQGRTPGAIPGLVLEPLDRRMRRRLGVPGEVSGGLVVTAVAPRSRAAAAGLRPGDVIVEAGGAPVDSVAALAERHRAADERLLLLAWREGITRYVVLEKEPAGAR